MRQKPQKKFPTHEEGVLEDARVEREDGAADTGWGVVVSCGFMVDCEEAGCMKEAGQGRGSVVAQPGAHAHDPGTEVDPA